MVAVSLAVLVLIGTSAYAWAGGMRNGATAGADVVRGEYHEQMGQILKTGDHTDLEALRAETGRPMMPWVQSQEDFDVWKARHDEMVAQYGEGPHWGAFGPEDGTGFGRGQDAGGRGFGSRGQGTGCPLWDKE